MYENSKGNLLTSLLSADSFTDLLTRAENFMQISKYDREMLKKYEQTKEKVADQKTAIKVEQEAIAQLQAESAEKRQEVEALAASTQEEISFYSEQIGRAEGEAADLLELVNEQSVQLASLMDKAEEEAEAARKAAEAELARQQEEEARLAQAAEQSPDVEVEIDPEVSLEASAQASPEETLQEGDGEDQTAVGDGDLEAAVGEAVEGTADQEEGETAGSEDTPEAAVTPEAAAQPEPTQAADTTGTGNSAGTYLGDFTLTAYCNCSKCCGSWSGGGTASGTVPTAGRTVAMGGIPFGTKLLINGNVYTVEDRGTGYGHVDIYMDSHSAALQFGSQKAAVYQLNN